MLKHVTSRGIGRQHAHGARAHRAPEIVRGDIVRWEGDLKKKSHRNHKIVNTLQPALFTSGKTLQENNSNGRKMRILLALRFTAAGEKGARPVLSNRDRVKRPLWAMS